MPKPTERALKRKPRAVVFLTTRRREVPVVPDERGARDFEWFDNQEAMTAHFDTVMTYYHEDAASHDDLAYLAVEVEDTSTTPMTLGRIGMAPETDKVKKWADKVQKDLEAALIPPVAKSDAATTEGPKRVVRARKKSGAAEAVKADGEDKAAALKKRLEEKKSEAPEATGDPAPTTVKKKWFVNEDGAVYDHDPATQEAEFPNDDHKAYGTKAAAIRAAKSGNKADSKA